MGATRARPRGIASGRLLIALMIVELVSACQPSGRSAGESGPDPAASDSEAVTGAASNGSAADATNLVRAYYRAIDERRYPDAYQLRESNGAASSKSFDEFRSGFSETAAVEAMLGTPGRVEGAAGSRYVDIPVRVVARLRNGATQEFTGTYTLRRSVVDGAKPEQRAWHIYSAKLRQVR